MASSQSPKSSVLGLDWDDTVTAFPDGFSILAGRFDRCVIITLNDDITVETARVYLNIENVKVEQCPYSRTDFMAWKIEMCRKHEVSVMMDDDPDIIRACEAAGIFAIGIAGPGWR